MVQLRSEACRRLSTSSGVAIAPDIVVTAAHNVAGAAEVDVIGPAETWTGVAVLVDTNLDLAFVRVEGADLTPARLADQVGDVVAVGLALRRPVLQPARLLREVSARTTDIYREHEVVKRALELDAVISPGDSGAPVLNSAGEVAGIVVSSTADSADSTAYAVHVDELRGLLDEAVGLRTPVETRCWR